MSISSFKELFNNAISQCDFNKNHFVEKFSAHNDFKKSVARYAHQFHTQFPEKFGKVIVISISNLDTRDGEVLYISPSAIKALKDSIYLTDCDIKQTFEVGCVFEYIGDYFQEKKQFYKEKGKDAAAVVNCDYNSAAFNKVIALREGDAVLSTHSYNVYSKNDSIKDNFLHESGHLLVKNGHSTGTLYEKHLAECAADALKAIEHYAEFGYNDWFHRVNDSSIAIIVGGSPSHYNNAITHAVRNISKNNDLSKLDFNEKLHLANKVSVEYSLSVNVLESITEAFYPVKNIFDLCGGALSTMAVALCIEGMLGNLDNHDVYRAGNEFLNNPIIKAGIDDQIVQGFLGWKQKMEELKYWEEIRCIELDLSKAEDSRSSYKESFIERIGLFKKEVPVRQRTSIAKKPIKRKSISIYA